ncbi:hypothetical protein ACHAWF_006584, partial [Thalassiosira exigua]
RPKPRSRGPPASSSLIHNVASPATKTPCVPSCSALAAKAPVEGNQTMFSFRSKSINQGPQQVRRSGRRSGNARLTASFTDTAGQRHEYDFDWELEPEYWYSKGELKAFNEVRFDEADVLRKERGIRTSSRNDADDMTDNKRDVFIGDKITNALDDVDDSHEISLRGIEHFVFPVLQKEMVRRKKDLKKTVLGYSRDPVARRKDPGGDKLALESAHHSQWARDVATERGIKYCQMKRGGGRGGGLLQIAKSTKGQRRMRGLGLEDM